MTKTTHRLALCFAAILTPAIAFFYATDTFPLEKRTVPYATENPVPEKRYAYYTITDESGTLELMRIPLLVHIGDEVLAADNKLYEIIRIDEDHAYAKFLRQIKL